MILFEKKTSNLGTVAPSPCPTLNPGSVSPDLTETSMSFPCNIIETLLIIPVIFFQDSCIHMYSGQFSMQNTWHIMENTCHN